MADKPEKGSATPGSGGGEGTPLTRSRFGIGRMSNYMSFGNRRRSTESNTSASAKIESAVQSIFQQSDAAAGTQGGSELAEAIRSGDVDAVRKHISKNGSESAVTARFSFEVAVQRLGHWKAKDQNCFSPATSQSAVMRVSSMQLAVIFRQPQVLEVLLKAAAPSQLMQASGLTQVMGSLVRTLDTALREKTRVQFAESAKHYSEKDRTLHGMTVFHLAARYDPDCLEVIVQFLKDMETNGSNQLLMIPESNEALREYLQMESNSYLRETPLHVAAANADNAGLKILLDNLPHANYCDRNDTTPLHVAVKANLEENALLLLSFGANPNAVGRKGETPMHRARSSKMVQILLQYGGDQYIAREGKDGVKRNALNIYLSRNHGAAELLLNECLSANENDFTATNLMIVYDLEPFKQGALNGTNGEMSLHTKILETNAREVLKHPLSEAFLELKYRLIRPFFLVNLAIFTIFTLLLTFLAVSATIFEQDCYDSHGQLVKHPCHPSGDSVGDAGTFYILFVLTFVIMAPLMIRELSQVWTTGLEYFADLENWIEVGIFTFGILFLTTVHTEPLVWPHFAAMSVLFCWNEMTLLLGRFPSIGIYVYMSVHVTKILIMFVLFYVATLIGFAFSFFLLLPRNVVFDSPISSAMKVLTMMLGEFDFSDNFLWDDVQGKGSNGTAQVVFMLFLFLVSIVIANLLIGMTVSQTEELLQTAGVIKLQKMAQQVMILEEVAVKNSSSKTSISRWTPHWITNMVVEKTQLFRRLSFLIMGNSNWNEPRAEGEESGRGGNGDGSQMRFKICVRPNHQVPKKSFWSAFDVFEMVNSMQDAGGDHFVYLYDDARRSFGPIITDTTLPNAIVQRSIEILKTREAEASAVKRFDGADFAGQVGLIRMMPPADPDAPPEEDDDENGEEVEAEQAEAEKTSHQDLSLTGTFSAVKKRLHMSQGPKRERLESSSSSDSN